MLSAQVLAADGWAVFYANPRGSVGYGTKFMQGTRGEWGGKIYTDVMTGVDTAPQARLTFEQQVSKDITLTYITNLNYTAEQIVRFEWNLNRQWSAVAVRDSNGLFGIDIQYRKRFK